MPVLPPDPAAGAAHQARRTGQLRAARELLVGRLARAAAHRPTPVAPLVFLRLQFTWEKVLPLKDA